jgi:hypothetical protein
LKEIANHRLYSSRFGPLNRTFTFPRIAQRGDHKQAKRETTIVLSLETLFFGFFAALPLSRVG